MDPKRIIAVVVGAVVMIVVFSAILIPILSDSTAPTKNYENDGVSFALMDDQTHTMVITNNGGVPEYVVDGVDTAAPEYLFNAQSTVIYGENGFLRVWKTQNDVRLRISVLPGESAPGVNLNDGDSTTITFDNTAITYGTTTANIAPVAYLSNEGTYIQKISPVVTDESIIYLAGVTEFVHDQPLQFIAMSGYGTIDDLTITALYSNVGTGVTVTDATYEATTTDLGNGLKRIDDIAITFTMSDDTTHVAHYTYFIAPGEVTYDNPSYPGSTLASLLNVIPIVAILGIVVAVVGALVIGRNDY